MEDEDLENKITTPETASVTTEPTKTFDKELFAKELLNNMRINL